MVMVKGVTSGVEIRDVEKVEEEERV